MMYICILCCKMGFFFLSSYFYLNVNQWAWYCWCFEQKKKQTNFCYWSVSHVEEVPCNTPTYTLCHFSPFTSNIPCDFSGFQLYMALQRETRTDPKIWVLCKRDGNRIQIFLPTASSSCCKVTTGSTIGHTIPLHAQRKLHTFLGEMEGKLIWNMRYFLVCQTQIYLWLNSAWHQWVTSAKYFLDPTPFIIF